MIAYLLLTFAGLLTCLISQHKYLRSHSEAVLYLGISAIALAMALLAGVGIIGATYVRDKAFVREEKSVTYLLPLDDQGIYAQYVKSSTSGGSDRILVKYERQGTLYYEAKSTSNIEILSVGSEPPKIVVYRYKVKPVWSLFFTNWCLGDDTYLFVNQKQVSLQSVIIVK